MRPVTSRMVAIMKSCCAPKGSALCLECHGPDSRPQQVPGQPLLSIFNGQVKLPEDYYQKNRVVILPIKYDLVTR